MLTLLWIAAVLAAVLVLAYVNASGIAFTAAIADRSRRRVVRRRRSPAGRRSC